ncbi:MAG: hypothetical protein ACRDZX_12920 [Acidimicrobiales bacterium]
MANYRLHVAAADDGSHQQRSTGEIGIVVLAQAEASNTTAGQVEDLGQGELPSSVGTSVRSPHHFRFTPWALKSRLTRSGMVLRTCPGGSGCGSAAWDRPPVPWAAIEAASALFSLTAPSRR